jgi:hypothetical protein
VEAEGYLARASFKLAQIYGQLGNGERQKYYMAAAEMIRMRFSGNSPLAEPPEEAYDSLVLWMLW